MAAFTAMQPAQLLPLGVPPAASSGPAPALRGAAAGEQPQPGQGGPSVSLAAGLLAGARLIAASRPAPGRARRGARRQQLRARGGNVATELRPADVQAQANGEAKAHEFAAEARQAAKLRAEKATTEAPAGVEDNAMIASAPAGEALATGGEVAAAAAEDDEDMSSRLRFIAPLLPLAVFPLVQAKDSAKRNMDLMAASQPAGSQMYNMSGWTPDVTSPCYESIYRWFPKAMPATPVFERSKLFINRLGMIPGNTLFGSSLCPDEINNKKGGTLDQMTNYWGEQFPLGGLGGVPLVGKTGWGAFSHHTPDNGNIFVIYGPHVGVSEDGQVGKILRPGQEELTSACGAFVGAYKQTEKWGGVEEMDGLDMQQQFIRNNLGPVRPDIAAAKNPMAELAYKAFSIVDKQMLSIVDLDCCDKLVLLGGIQVNTPDGFPDHFAPMRFEVREKGKTTQSLMKAFNPAIDPNAFAKEAARSKRA